MTAAPGRAAPEVRPVAVRLADSFTSTSESASEIGTLELTETLDVNGHWPDLDLKYPPETQSGVSRYVHFLRIWKIAGAWRHTTDKARRAELAAVIHKALGFWLHKPAPASIPWFNLIGTPQALARAALVFEEELSPEELSAAIAILKTCVDANGVLQYAGSPATGQNLQHEAEIQIVVGCLSNDPGYLARHASLIEKEIAIRDAEGLKADWSFHQHGPQLYSGGLYGSGFARDGAKLAWALRDTPFAFAQVTVDSLVHYVLDGQQWMTRGRSFDFLTVGRMVAWPDFKGVEPEGDEGVADAAIQLAELVPGRREELLAFSKRFRGNIRPETAPAGNRVFWASDYVSQQRPGFFASCRMSSRRSYGTESGGGQNELGYHLGDGAMTLMVSGEEYRNIYPLWDWRRVPGVTAVYNPSIPPPRHMWGKGSQGWSDFAGGVSDGTVGAAAMELRRGGLHAKKAWFFLDDVVVCLGAAIQPDDPTLPVVTSIDQRWASGVIHSSTSASDPSPPEAGTLEGPGWVHHAGISYLFSGAGKICYRRETKSAPWSVINRAVQGSMFRKLPLTEVEVSGEVFSLWLDHGVGIYSPTHYAYVVAPGLAPQEIETFNRTTAPRILVNSDAIQAISRDGLIQAVFWQPGTLDLTDSRTLTVDRPGIIQLRQDPKNRRWTLAAGNPTHQPGPMRVRLSWLSDERVFDFPKGLYAGRPMTLEFPEN